MSEKNERIIKRIQELEKLPPMEIIEEGYKLVILLTNAQAEELRAVLQALLIKILDGSPD